MRTPYYEAPGFVLYHGDCREVLAEMAAECCDLIFADPPYFLSHGSFTCHAGKAVSVKKADWDLGQGAELNFAFHLAWLRACRRVLKPHGSLWVSGTYHSIYQCGYALQLAGYQILNDIVWLKPNAPPNLSCRYFTASHETLLWARKTRQAKHTFHYQLAKHGDWDGDRLKAPGMQMRSVWSLSAPRPEEKRHGRHPTQKPLELLRRIILLTSNEGDLVLDPFTGSSTTGLAAYACGRRFIGIDTEAAYLELSVRRFEALCARPAAQARAG